MYYGTPCFFEKTIIAKLGVLSGLRIENEEQKFKNQKVVTLSTVDLSS